MSHSSPYTLLPLESQHLEDAARLVSQRYQDLRRQHPLLPEKYTRQDVLLPLLESVLQAGRGIAAFDKGRLVGFLSGYLLPQFMGSPSAFSPEWANAADMQDSRRIYEALYTIQAEIWVKAGYPTHLISMLVNDQSGIQGWHWLGFGLVAADAIRPLEPVPVTSHDLHIRQAILDDADSIMQLDHALIQHVTALSHLHPPRGGSTTGSFTVIGYKIRRISSGWPIRESSQSPTWHLVPPATMLAQSLWTMAPPASPARLRSAQPAVRASPLPCSTTVWNGLSSTATSAAQSILSQPTRWRFAFGCATSIWCA